MDFSEGMTLLSRRGTVLFAALAVLCPWLTGIIAVDAEAASRCDRRVGADYLRQAESFPAVRTPPRSGQLPFAPKGVYLENIAPTNVLSGGWRFGYGVSIRHGQADAIRLNWRVSVLVTQLAADGSLVANDLALTRTIRRIRIPEDLDELRFGIRTPAELGFYRYRIIFRRLDGKSLGSYAQYFRVVPERWLVRLRTNGDWFSPGSQIRLRVLNRGTVPLAFGEGVSVKVRQSGMWKNSGHFKPRPVHRIAFDLFAGEISKCEVLHVPLSTPPGRYRLEKRVSSLTDDREETLLKEFAVRR